MKTAQLFGVMLVAIGAFAQGGANYSALGIGQTRTTFGAAYEALAGAAYAIPSDYLFSIANPALWTLVKTTRVQGGYRFNQQRIEQGGAFRAQNNGKLDGAALLFAIDTSREIAASVGLFPATTVNYASARNFQFQLPELGMIEGTTTYRGTGGMTIAYAGGAVRVAPGLSLGAALLYGFGIIGDQNEIQVSTEASQRAVTTQTDKLSTIGVRLGTYSALGSGWSTGIAVGLFRPLEVERQIRYQSFVEGENTPTFDTMFTSRLLSPFPSTIGAGVTYTGRRWMLTLDGEWSSSHVLRYRLSPLAQARDSYRASLAVSYFGSRGAGVSFEDKLTVNAGVYIQRLPVAINTRPVEEYGAAVGLQIPFGGAAMIDAAITAGVRGNGLPVREEFFRFSATISVGEVWFVPFRR
ncbi:MAG: hypothetical protein NZ606_07735 [Candidatus Kapabacteria bacterium]|nr:hypothetical protein [Candidatus Kapabacteria bacterium]